MSARTYYAKVEITMVLDHAPDELKGTTGYFRPEKARWNVSRGSQWSRSEEERDAQWAGFWESVEVYGPKTRAPQGGQSGAFFWVADIPEWLAAQAPALRDDAMDLLIGASR